MFDELSKPSKWPSPDLPDRVSIDEHGKLLPKRRTAADLDKARYDTVRQRLKEKSRSVNGAE